MTEKFERCIVTFVVVNIDSLINIHGVQIRNEVLSLKPNLSYKNIPEW